VSSIEAVVFDLDGVIVDSEHVWDEVREELAHQRHGRWHEHAQADMMGMSAPEWSRYMHKVIGLTESPAEINELVVTRMLERYEEALPLIDGTVDVVLRLAETFRLALASSSNRLVIDSVLDHAARRLNVPPARCAAIEDSANGLRAAHAASMRVIAIPNRRYPPEGAALGLADVVLTHVNELTPRSVRGS
jgi:beta-phosphoglucomutase-like phosphatase (HAD superfamily)